MKPGLKREAPEPGKAAPACRPRQLSRGAALPVVLVLLSLILLLALMTLDTGVHHAGKERLVADSMRADLLTRLPVHIVLSQLNAATVDLPRGTNWTSQPGMIRTFRTQPNAGNEPAETLVHYRLYSAAVMNSPVLKVAQESAGLEGWNEKPSGYTDLNEPVASFRRGSTELVYPIADPARLGVVGGYALRSAAPAASLRQPLPLPAAWIYVLEDGQLIVPAGCDAESASFDSEKATASNPIVGRVAFWTDDESCKLNLNTASEPEPWDTPAANTLTERQFAENPPFPDEAYRISTHPAYTGLGVVLQHSGKGTPDAFQTPMEVSASRSPICYQDPVPDGVLTPASGVMTSKRQHFFPSVDEFFYGPSRAPNGQGAGFRVTPLDLRQSRFLLTTHSSAPELNPWGQPKICLWMMPRNLEERSHEDRRMNACSMLPGGAGFIFQRAAGWKEPAHPGSSQSMTADWSEVPRNRELYAWLQSLTDLPVPGYRRSFAEKYGRHSRDQILTSMLDMLRWSVNPASYLPPADGSSNPGGAAQESAVPLTVSNADGTAWTRGFGRFPTTTEVAIVFAFTDVERLPNGRPRDADGDGICDRATKLRAFMVVKPFLAASGPPAVSPSWSTRIRRLQHFTIGQGIGLLLPGGNARNRCTFPGPLLFNDSSANPGACLLSQFLQPDGQAKQTVKRDDPARDFPFISSNDVRLPADAGQPGTSIRFSGGAIIVDFMEPDAPQVPPRPNDAIHSVEMEFPNRSIPFPSLAVADFASGPRHVESRFSSIAGGGNPALSMILKEDVVRSMILNPDGPTRGDVRLLAAQREALFASDAANRVLFVPHPDYDSAQVMQADHLRQGAMLPDRSGDWENGAGLLGDGPGVNRSARQSLAAFMPGPLPPQQSAPPAQPFSAVNFGAIPSGLFGDTLDPTPRPWQTLLFCPNPAGRPPAASPSGQNTGKQPAHPGLATPPDHLWLELFWRPILDPRPLSAGFATEGKVNLNFQILPWTWLRRSSALHGTLQGVRLAAIPDNSIAGKSSAGKAQPDGPPPDFQIRYAVDAPKTITAFEQRFDAGGIFRYPSEICAVFLAPKRLPDSNYNGPGTAPADPEKEEPGNMASWWNGRPETAGRAFGATGDNLRESPYAQIYSRICTQSNVFRVHYKVQVLKKVTSSPPAVWREARDVVVNERRGSYLVERRFAPPDPTPDPATLPGLPSLHTRHRMVIAAHETFAP